MNPPKAHRSPPTTQHARLTVLLDAERKKAFEELCRALGSNPSEVVRQLVAEYLAGNRPEPSLAGPRPARNAEPPGARK